MPRTGRPSEYNGRYHIPWVKSLARRGLTVKEIAKEMGIAKSTLCKWVKENPDLSDALNEGRSYADALVENSLFSLTQKSTVTEKKTIVSSSDTEQKPLRIEITEKDVPPSAAACIFWLKNRQKDRWRELPKYDNDQNDLNEDEEVKFYIPENGRDNPET